MKLTNITQNLASENPQDKLRGITALRGYDAAIAAPLLLSQIDDNETIIRSFAAMGLGYKQTPEGFERLTQMMQDDADPNVRAEALAALAKYGDSAIEKLVEQFPQDQHWLVQVSILLILPEMDVESFLRVCRLSMSCSEETVQSTAVEQLGRLAGTAQESAALDLLLDFAVFPSWLVRSKTIHALRAFDADAAFEMIQTLRKDSDHRVVAATLEGLIEQVADS